VLSVFLRKGFNNPNASHHLLNDRHSPSVQGFYRFRLFPRLLAGGNRQQQQQGSDTQCDKSQGSIDADCYENHSHQREQ
jgi:hypothetical protein